MTYINIPIKGRGIDKKKKISESTMQSLKLEGTVNLVHKIINISK